MKTSWCFLLVILIFLVQFRQCASYKILMVFPSFSPSHLIVASGLLKGLARLGHQVTMVSSFPQEEPLKNYRDIILPLDDTDKDSIMSQMVKRAGSPLNLVLKMPSIFKMSYDMANRTMSNTEFRKIMEEETFDVVILGLFGNEFLIGLGYHFNCPVVVLSQVHVVYIISELVGNPLSVATTSHISLGYNDRMTFAQRAVNFLIICVEIVMTNVLRRIDRTYYESNFPPEKYPSFDEAIHNVSLVLVNHHFTQGNVRANFPAMVEIGGVHIDDEIKPLPEDIQDFLDSATNGAIFFSLGSNVKSSFLPSDKLNAIVRALGGVKEKVLFKWENETLAGKPDNMMIGKWMPQMDILAHKNIKLFVNHGGMGSLSEAKYHGVPVIGVPFFGDQMGNIESASKEGWAYKLNFDTLTEDSFSTALEEVLGNPKYKIAVQKISQLYRDRPQTALETANFWLEYIIRHKGAPHMQSQAVHMNIWQKNSIDVLAFLIAVVLLATKLLIILLKFLLKVTKRKLNGQKEKQL